MSTKTSFKRIALVAASALAIAGFSAVPAHAANAGTATFTVAGGTGTTTNTVTKTVLTGTYVAALIDFVDTVDNVNTISSTGVGTIQVPTINAAIEKVATTGVTATGATVYAAELVTSVPGSSGGTFLLGSIDGAGADGSLNISATSLVAGTQTITITGSAGISTLVITYGAAPVVSAGYSTSYTGAADTADPLTSDAAIVFTAGDGITSTQAGVIQVSLLSGFATTITAGLSVSVSGPGNIALTKVTDVFDAANNQPSTGRSLSLTAAGAIGDQYAVAVWNDGTAGTSTITIKSGTTLIATETVVFYGSVAKVSATQVYSIADASGVTALGADTTNAATQDSAVIVKLTDALGNAAVATPSFKTNDTSVITGLDTSCDADAATPGTYYCDINPAANDSGKSTTTYFYVTVSGVDIKSDLLTFKLGGTVKTVTVALDSGSYDPGTAVALSFTAKDSSGNPVFDGTRANFLGTGGVIFNYGTGVSTTSTSKSFVGGVATLNTYAPLASGSLVAKGTYGADAGSLVGTTFNTSSTVNGDANASLALDAANAATDAANNAYDEAQNATQAASDALAAVSELAAQVTDLIAMVKKLTAAVAKLSKKK